MQKVKVQKPICPLTEQLKDAKLEMKELTNNAKLEKEGLRRKLLEKSQKLEDSHYFAELDLYGSKLEEMRKKNKAETLALEKEQKKEEQNLKVQQNAKKAEIDNKIILIRRGLDEKRRQEHYEEKYKIETQVSYLIICIFCLFLAQFFLFILLN